jgi:hypothetical protein
MRAWPTTLTLLVGVAALAPTVAGCSVGVPEGKPWTVDTAAWAGSQHCSTEPCSLDAYRTRDFTTEALVPAALTDGEQVQVHCWVPPPATQRGPSGRDSFTWYLVTADDTLLWAPDLALTSDVELRRDPTDEGSFLSSQVVLCHSAVPGR